jgi:molecular chaperone DnaK (HSP70)
MRLPRIAAKRGSIMNAIQMFEKLRGDLACREESMAALGIDLGTTKSCAAIARFDPDVEEIICACVPYPEAGVPGEPIAVPSVVAIQSGQTRIGHAARRLVGQKGFIPQRDVFRETKNEIGLHYTYWKAPEGFGSATQIATILLKHLRDGIDDEVASPCVVTVPASFHGAQRMATLAAASTALGNTRLLDEPYAAFLDLLFRQPDAMAPLVRDGANILVFDFGGGTCDVAIFTLTSCMGTLEPLLRSTSRYHRIGGGDIDRAIIHDLLIPQLLERHGLSRTAFSWQEKRKLIEPQLQPLAERLKIALCRRINEYRAAGKPVEQAEAVAAGEYEVVVADSSYWIDSPVLGFATFQRILSTFIDPEPPPESSDEYVQRGSIFSPIRHALYQARLDAEEIDGIVLAGGSSLIPQVQDALRSRFTNAVLLSCGSGEELQGAIARGAALQALAIAATGKPLLEPVASAAVGVSTNQGWQELVPAGARLPAKSGAPIRFFAPHDSPRRNVEICIEVGDGSRISGRSIWALPAPVRMGEALDLTWQLDENQCLVLQLVRREDADTEPFRHHFIAPISHIDQGHVARCRMLEREQAVRDGRVEKSELGAAFTQIAKDAKTLGENEKALHFLSLAIMEQGATQYLLNLRGLYRENVGDKEGAEQSYRAAGECDSALFNMALMQTRENRHDEALASIEQCIEITPSREHTVLKAQILEKLGKPQDARLLYVDAVDGVIDPQDCEDWQLYWLLKAARVTGRNELVSAIETEQKQRSVRTKQVGRQGALPDRATDSASALTLRRVVNG